VRSSAPTGRGRVNLPSVGDCRSSVLRGLERVILTGVGIFAIKAEASLAGGSASFRVALHALFVN
jgi:hypothetical protein